MLSRKISSSASRRKGPVKRLVGSMLQQHEEEVKKDKRTSSDPTQLLSVKQNINFEFQHKCR